MTSLPLGIASPIHLGRSTGPPLAYAERNGLRFLEQLKELVHFPSVSAQPRHAVDTRRCAAWLAGQLREIGLNRVRLLRTPGHPLVYGEWVRAPGRLTLLIYGHYDVQPAGPLEEWRTPPFEATLRGDDLYGRGTSDDKGQLFVHVKALESYLRSLGELPINVRCLFEGEEEIGSPNLIRFLARRPQFLAADAVVMSDTRILAPGRPAVIYALRGMLNVQVEVRGPRRDLHSGAFGGAVHNPIQALCEVLAGLHDDRRRVTIPGFYDRVRRWGPGERAFMARSGPTDPEILGDAAVGRGWGESGYTLYERTTLRPAVTINGIQGGSLGPAARAAIPSRASARINFRLVPDQDPEEIERLVRVHLARVVPSPIRVSMRVGTKASPVLVDRDHPAARAAADAYHLGFGAAPVFLRSGGSIPVAGAFQRLFHLPVVLMGFALSSDGMHGPNEKFHLPNFYNGIATSIAFLGKLAELPAWHRKESLGRPAPLPSLRNSVEEVRR